MKKEEILKKFEIWWHEEGKFITPGSSDWESTKEAMKLAWLNGAYTKG